MDVYVYVYACDPRIKGIFITMGLLKIEVNGFAKNRGQHDGFDEN